MVSLSYIVNTITADDLVMEFARVSAGLVLTYLSWNFPVLTPKRLNWEVYTFKVYAIYILQSMKTNTAWAIWVNDNQIWITVTS